MGTRPVPAADCRGTRDVSPAGPRGWAQYRTSVLARLTGFARADARNIWIPIEEAEIGSTLVDAGRQRGLARALSEGGVDELQDVVC